ncbi:adenylate cyclase [Paenibacillus sp. IB182496]|uniref:Adenylate cyclase n=1 Tax=Paenibacillus sabuli TaxID=2772509 RepID=A0A927BY35_9BACL|nr:F390 synthetase-related protein [Paenibacillus sabuli]MBD2847609.1 adenylate cyclase [Paenibacillus sabuli]
MIDQAAAFLLRYARSRRPRRWRDRAHLEAWQERRIRRHVAQVRRRSPYYRELWDGIPDERWREFPQIDKSAMMANFERLNTAGIDREEAFAVAARSEHTRDFRPTIDGVTVGLSSGTSGHRGLFLVGPREQAAWAGAMLGRMLPGGLLRRCRIALFLRADSNLYESVGRGRLAFGFYDLLVPMEAHLERLERERPDCLVAPPSVLLRLARAAERGALRWRPRRLISAAEVLDPRDGERIEGAFGQVVHQIYQCTEGFLGCTCAHGTLHLNEDLVAIEREYVAGRPDTFVPVVTDFSRTTQPIIRYRLNDLLTLRREPCPCGSPFTALARIEGRCDDVFCAEPLAGGGTGPLIAVYPDFVTRAILAASPAIEQYRAIQIDAETWTIELDVAPAQRRSAEAGVQRELAALCRRLACRMPALQFAPYAAHHGPAKLRRVERRWQP